MDQRSCFRCTWWGKVAGAAKLTGISLAPFDHAPRPDFTALSVGFGSQGRSKLRGKLFLRTFRPLGMPFCTVSVSRIATSPPISASKEPLLCRKIVFRYVKAS